MKKLVTVVDYGMGNLGSICNMLRKIGVKTIVTSCKSEIGDATSIILPGVGHFDSAVKKIGSLGLREVLDQKALVDRVPILGICLGMQLLTRSSEEGQELGFGWIGAATKRFMFTQDEGWKVPHMGWNSARTATDHELVAGLGNEFRFYFVHSYYVVTDSDENSLLKTTYGFEFDSAIYSGNIFGVQFHPEKSHRFGMKLLQNFTAI